MVLAPYRSEAQSGVALTAFHFGRPVIATAVGGLPKIDDRNGILVPPGRFDRACACRQRILHAPRSGGDGARGRGGRAALLVGGIRRDNERLAVGYGCAVPNSPGVRHAAGVPYGRQDEILPTPHQGRPRTDLEVQPALRDVPAAGAPPSVRGHGVVARREGGARDPRPRAWAQVASRDGRTAALLAHRRRDPAVS